MDARMFIITHKEFSKPQIPGYYSLLVGANTNKFDDADYRDNDGDNISDKNKCYCELTGLYWIWKNISCDIVGFCHYRRYFTKNRFLKTSKCYVTVDDMEQYMNEYDVVMPTTRYYKETTYEALNIAPNIADMEEIKKAIDAVCPEYMEAFQNYLHSNRCYLYNMFIMRKTLLDTYCKWLFPILEYIENDYTIDEDDPYRSRLLGFLSERLIYVWIIKNIQKSRIKEIRVVKTDESGLWLFGQDIKNIIRNYVYHLRHIGRK